MNRRVLLVPIAMVALAGVTLPAHAEAPPAPPAARTAGRFVERDLSRLGKISYVPRSAHPDDYVAATVQLTGDPVAVAALRAQEAGAAFNSAAASASVAGTQRAATSALNAAGATVVGATDQVLNAVRVRVKVSDLPKVAAVPGVVRVQVARTVRIENGVSDTFTGASRVWEDFGYTGTGLTVGVIDDGIDYTHADFGGSGDPADYEANNPKVIEPGTFPTAKVVGGTDFVGDAYDADSDVPRNTIPRPDPDPLACGVHGTHVSGTAAGAGVLSDGSTFAGPYNASTIDTNDFNVAPGSAPGASIRMYKVFGCDGSVTDDIVVDAIDQAVADGVDVINLSLGSDFGTEDSLDAVAIDNASAEGVLVVASAGNAGPGAYVVGSPSTASTALSVAAMDVASKTLPGANVTGAVNTTLQISNDATLASPVSGALVDVGLGCEAADYAGTSGKIAVATRGVCDRIARAQLGDAAGAKAVIMINNGPGFPPLEGAIPGVDIAFLGATPQQGSALLAAVGSTVTISKGSRLPNPSYQHFASFSSNGPRRLDSAPKPDITAPGVSVLSAFRGSGTGGTLLSGTSMSSPHTAGIAVLVRQSHPGWTPGQVKAVMMSTADPALLVDYDSQRGGAGVVRARRAVESVSYLWTSDGLNSVAFGFHQVLSSYSNTKIVKITNTSDTTISYDLTAAFEAGSSQGSPAPTVSVSPSRITLAGHSSTSVNVTAKISLAAMKALPGATDGGNGVLDSLRGAISVTPRNGGPGIYPLRMRFNLVPKPLSNVSSSRPTLGISGRDTASGNINVRNNGYHAGDADVYQWAITDPKGDNPTPEVPDITDVGVQSFDLAPDGSDKLVVFGVSMGEATSTQATHEVDVYLETTGDDQFDYVVIGVDNGLLTAGSPDGTLISATLDLATGEFVDAWDAVGPMNGSAMLLPVSTGAIGVTAASAPMVFAAQGFTILTQEDSDDTDVGAYDPFTPALSNGAFVTLPTLGSQANIPANATLSQLPAQAPLGWLVITLDDAGGRQADRVPLRIAGFRASAPPT